MSPTPSPSLSSMLIKQRERWQRGDQASVEVLLNEQPALRDQAEPVLELLYNEMLLSEERGQIPQLDDYLQRFPQFADELRLQFEIHAALADDDVASVSDGEIIRASLARDSGAPGGTRRSPQVDGYELLSELGRGGMGVVYKARQIKLNRIVALKMIRAGLLAGTQELARFRHEAEVVAQLQHPHIVQIHEVGEAQGWPYLALEFVDGTSLEKALGGKPQPAVASARLVETLARTMHYAHLRGVVHRDLKPANVLLGSASAVREATGKTPTLGQTAPTLRGKNETPPPNRLSSADRKPEPTKGPAHRTIADTPLSADVVKITDFGLAKNLDLGAAGPTHTGDVLGTPSYMAPEQAGGKSSEVGFAADIYSLGAILYEMLTGRPPFVAETMVETLLMVRTQEPSSPSRIRPDLPRDLVTICLTCLQKQPWRRYSTALDLADDLRHFLEHEPIRARPIGLIERGVKWARRRPAAATLIGTILLVTVFGFLFVSWQLKQTAGALADARRANAETKAQNYLNSVALAHHELLAHHVDQAQLLLEECPPAQRRWEWHYLQRMCQTDLFTMSGHVSEVRALAYSKDGRFIASGSGNWYEGFNDGEVRVWDAHSGKELHRLLRNTGTVFAVAFSPDSKLLATGGRMDEITLWNVETGERVRDLRGNGRSGIFDLAFSPDGKQLVSANFDLSLWDVEQGTLIERWKKHTSMVFSTSWSPDGRLIASTDRKGEVHLWDPERKKHLRLLAKVADLRCSSFSPDSSQLAAGSWNGTIWTWDMKNLEAPGTARQTNNGQVYDLAFAPEGRRLAFAGRDGVKIWELKSGEEMHDFAGHNGVAPSLAFSPDGTRLATGGVDGSLKVWDATVREEFRRYLDANSAIRGFVDGPDGKFYAIGSVDKVVKLWNAANSATVHSIPFDSVPLTAAAADSSGQTLAWIGNNATLYLWDRQTKEMRWMQPLGKGPITGLAYNSSGTELAWGDTEGIVHLLDAASGASRGTLGEPGKHLTGVAYHPHGKLLAALDEEGKFRVWDLASQKKVAEFGGSRRNVASGGEEVDSQFQSAPRMARLSYSPDGQRLISSTRLRPPEIWDAATGRLALILDRAVDGADFCAFTGDGRQLYAGLGAQVRVWNTTDENQEERRQIAREHAIAWHQKWYPICIKEGNWAACALHLKPLVEADPKSAAYRETLGDAYGFLGQLEQARVENDKALELGRRTFLVFYNQACLALEAGDLATYRQACLNAFEKLPVNGNAERANSVAWISCLHQDAPGSPTGVLELVDLALEKKPDDYGIRNTRGAALYRVGLYRDAIAQLQAAIEVHEKKEGNATDWVFLAMAHARLGEFEQAQVWLQKARTTPPMRDWQQDIEIRSLLKEATDIIPATTLPAETSSKS